MTHIRFLTITNFSSESLVNLLRERAREERALLRNEITLYVTDKDIADGVACTGLPEYEVVYQTQVDQYFPLMTLKNFYYLS